jgi:uncharacterized protein YjbJ (UPF0337 family)
MSAKDKAKNTGEKAAGKAQEVGGRVAGSARTEGRGRRTQVKADVKNTGEQLKDAGSKAKNAVKH